MSNPTPPGWYPVPGTGQERWWDGSAWTDSHRPANRLNDAVTQSWSTGPATTAESWSAGPSTAPPSPPNGGGGRGLVLGATGAVVAVVIGAVAVAVWALQPEAAKKPDPSPSLTIATSSPGPSRSSSPTPDGSIDPSLTIADRTHGWGVPLPEGWTAEPATDQASVLEISGQYACSQSSSLCVRGQFAVAADPVDAPDARTAAEHEIAAYAPSVFGDLKDHDEQSSGTLDVAGASGWAIRWYVHPQAEGPAGYVVVAAVPASGGGYVILHGGVDDDPKAPQPAVLDRIMHGIRQAS
ncbi:DUF2510 domain-containing protein [Kitasatospora cheerisanensis]|uniref:DUF2510 domain-containing protein n=1 Tax=Kitasatospora cheerisanensis KCTC 2395 TaxID=1348663 RepID=A0A066Z7Y5_9ACTN|nr:DUF2510 domain-containing protein [Kitasatospora cheerisanensis]KDN86441.1 hypothetical protein KCH_22580 [Kitasatospora cheerisanensis KCTC 2395]